MLQFAIRYVCIGVVGAAACYFATPPARKFVLGNERIGRVARQHIGESMQGLGNWFDDTVQNWPSPAGQEDEDVALRPGPAEISVPWRIPVAPVPEPSSTVDSKPPSSVMASRDKGPERWGVVQQPTAKIYDLSGKFVRRIEAGACVEFVRTVRGKDGREFARARIMPNRSGQEILVALETLDLVDGPFAEASRTEQSLRMRRARLLGKIAENDRARERQLNPANPYARKYETASQEYMSFWRKVEELKKAANGPGRVRALDELRLMKGQDIRVGQAYKAAKTDYESWEQNHPRSPAADEQMAAIQKQLAEIDRQLREM